MELVTITNYEAWEYARMHHCTVASDIASLTRECAMILLILWSRSAPAGNETDPVVSFSGGRPNHSLDGITISQSSSICGKPAIEMESGMYRIELTVGQTRNK